LRQIRGARKCHVFAKFALITRRRKSTGR
jgi:hypothetical protein